MVVTKAKLIFVVYKNQVDFCKQVTKPSWFLASKLQKPSRFLASSNMNQVGF